MPSGYAHFLFDVGSSHHDKQSFVPSLLVFFMAVVIAQSRVSTGAHKPLEVVVGALLASL